MSDVIETSEDGRFRVIIETDNESGGEMPDGDAYGYVMRRTYTGGRYVWQCENQPYRDHGGTALAARMTTAENNADIYGDQLKGACDAVERAMMRAGAIDWHDFRSYVDRSGDEWRLIVTRDHLDAWGLDENDADHPAQESARDWQYWLDGDVYGYVIEESCTWTTNTIGGVRTQDGWETVDHEESGLWGLYGREYAEERAREAWGEFLADVVSA